MTAPNTPSQVLENDDASSVEFVGSSPTAGRGESFAVWSSLTLMALATATSAVFFTFFGPYATSIGLTVVLVGAATSTFGVVRFFTYIALAKQSLTLKLLDGRVRLRNLVVFACLGSLSSLLFLIRDPTAQSYFGVVRAVRNR